MMVEGVVSDAYSTGSDWNVIIESNGGRSVTTRIWATTGIDGNTIAAGNLIRAYGVGGVYNSAFQLIPALPEDIIISTAPPVGEKPSLTIAEGVFDPVNDGAIKIDFSVPTGYKATLRPLTEGKKRCHLV
jgi:hypothetical protein